jgi:hypothetical protein
MEIVYICGVENVGDNKETKQDWRLRSLGPEFGLSQSSCAFVLLWVMTSQLSWITELKQVSALLTGVSLSPSAYRLRGEIRTVPLCAIWTDEVRASERAVCSAFV